MFENFEIRTIFKCDGVEYCLSSLNNQFYSIYFDKSEEHVKVYLEPKQTLILIKFALLLDIQLDKDCLIYENTFYNQITSKEYRIGDLKDSEKPIKVSNSEIKNFDIDYGKFKSYSFTRIKRNNDEMVLGSLDESNGFTVFGLDTPNNLLVIEKDVIGLKINKEIEILNVKCYGNSGTNQFHSYFKELGLKKKNEFSYLWVVDFPMFGYKYERVFFRRFFRLD